MDKKFDIVDLMQPDIIQESQLNIENYNEVDNTSEDNELVGHTTKTFVRCDKSAISNLINEIKNNRNSSYITYINDAIKEGVVPNKISLLTKKGSGAKDLAMINCYSYSLEHHESIASRILNFLGCPTCYNFVVQDHLKRYVASVDFISADEKFYTFSDFSEALWPPHVEKQLKLIDKVMENFKFNSPEERIDNIQKIKKDFLYSFLVRVCLLADGDFHAGNFGFLYNEKTKSMKLINFDMEFLFLNPNLFGGLKNSIKYIKEKDFDVYNKFIYNVKRIKSLFKRDSLKDISNLSDFAMYHKLYERLNSILKYDKALSKKEKVKFLVKLTREKSPLNKDINF